MIKYYSGVLICLIALSVNAQRSLFNQRYDQIYQDFEIGKKEFEAHQLEGKIIVFNEEKHKTKLAKKLLKSRKGKTRLVKRAYYDLEYEVIGKEDVTHHRVRYIFIDKNRFKTDDAFDEYLKKIRSLLEDIAFKSVAMQYSMDYQKNVGGDSGWFKEGKTHPGFYKNATATNKLADEIFEFEIAENGWYYVVKKTHAKKDFNEVMVVEKKMKK